MARATTPADSRSVDVDETAARLATVAGQVARLEGAGPEPRACARIGGIDVADRGVDTPWSVQAHVPSPPPAPERLAEAVAWCRTRGGPRSFRVSASVTDTAPLERLGLVAHEAMGVFAIPASQASQLGGREIPALKVGPPIDRTEVVTAYGGWMSDVPLADALLRESDVDSPSRRFLVGRVDGRPIGCALVWFAGGTAYLSGIGVVPGARRRGYGRALTEAAAQVGAEGPAGGCAPDLIWMNATTDGAGLYSTMGFQRVDVYALLGP